MANHADRFRHYANAQGDCDTCNIGQVPVYREGTEEGWQECERCDKAREDRRAARLARKAAANG